MCSMCAGCAQFGDFDADIVAGASVFFRAVSRLVTGEAAPAGTPYSAERSAFEEAPTNGVTAPLPGAVDRAVLLCIDLQNMGPTPRSDFTEPELAAFDNALQSRVMPGVRRLQQWFRALPGAEVVRDQSPRTRS